MSIVSTPLFDVSFIIGDFSTSLHLAGPRGILQGLQELRQVVKANCSLLCSVRRMDPRILRNTCCYRYRTHINGVRHNRGIIRGIRVCGYNTVSVILCRPSHFLVESCQLIIPLVHCHALGVVETLEMLESKVNVPTDMCNCGQTIAVYPAIRNWSVGEIRQSSQLSTTLWSSDRRTGHN